MCRTYWIPARGRLKSRGPAIGIAAIHDVVQDLWVRVERWVHKADLGHERKHGYVHMLGSRNKDIAR